MISKYRSDAQNANGFYILQKSTVITAVALTTMNTMNLN